MSRSNVVPAFLNQSTYAAIRLQMVAVAPSLPGAATFFPKDADYTTIPTHRNTDASLVRQLAQVLHPLIGLEVLAHRPQLLHLLSIRHCPRYQRFRASSLSMFELPHTLRPSVLNQEKWQTPPRVRDVSLIRGNWYEHAQSSDEDPIVPAKSIHQEFFNLIGLQTYESYQAYIEHFANSGFTNKL